MKKILIITVFLLNYFNLYATTEYFPDDPGVIIANCPVTPDEIHYYANNREANEAMYAWIFSPERTSQREWRAVGCLWDFPGGQGGTLFGLEYIDFPNEVRWVFFRSPLYEYERAFLQHFNDGIPNGIKNNSADSDLGKPPCL